MDIMEHKGFKAQVMEAERLVGDQVFGLPPGRALECYPVDMFIGAPLTWCKGPGVFVIPVKPGKGLWFNWTKNDGNNTAVLPTVKGCNPITGLATSGYHLERYDTKCPKHGVDFMHGRFCPECNYKWPPQNYVAAPNILWLDVWNSGDGVGRQLFFTEDELRDVASAMISKENTVPAFGFAFYRPKVMRESKPTYIHNVMFSGPKYSTYLGSSPGSYSLYNDVKVSSSTTKSSSKGFTKSTMRSKKMGAVLGESHTYGSISGSSVDNVNTSENTFMCNCNAAPAAAMEASGSAESFDMDSLIGQERGINQETPVKEVSVAAGSRINQSISLDPYLLDSWRDAPDSVMTIYFVFQDKFEEIKKGGIRDLTGKKEGMLSNIPVG